MPDIGPSTPETPRGEKEALEAIEEKRDLFERIAAADLPMSERTAAVLEWADERQREGGVDG